MLTGIMQKELRHRRNKLLTGMAAVDLLDMRRKITGETDFLNAYSLRMRILDDWDAYADEIRRWCEFTISGEAVL